MTTETLLNQPIHLNTEDWLVWCRVQWNWTCIWSVLSQQIYMQLLCMFWRPRQRHFLTKLRFIIFFVTNFVIAVYFRLARVVLFVLNKWSGIAFLHSEIAKEHENDIHIKYLPRTPPKKGACTANFTPRWLSQLVLQRPVSQLLGKGCSSSMGSLKLKPNNFMRNTCHLVVQLRSR